MVDTRVRRIIVDRYHELRAEWKLCKQAYLSVLREARENFKLRPAQRTMQRWVSSS